MAESARWLLRLMAAAAVVMALAVGAASPWPAWAATVPDAVAQRDDEDEDEDADADDQPADEDAADEDDAGDDDETYESPLYGYTLTYDSAEWEILQEDRDPDDDYDQLFLTNGVSVIGLTGDPDYDDDDLTDCLEDYIGGLENNESSSDIEPLDERDAEGEDDDRAWQTFTYTFETEDGDEDFIRYYECRWLDDGLTLVILHDTPDADYEDEIEAREDLLEGFSPPDATADDEDDTDADDRDADDADQDDRDADDDDRDATEDEDDTADRDADDAGGDDDDLLADVEEYEVDDISHTEDPVDYDPLPPVGGAHSPVWQDCGFYDEEIVTESGVHSMEHGAVWITYDPDLDEDEVEILEELADSEAYVLVSPFEDLPSPVVASAWGVQLELDSADDPALEAFVEFYAEGPQTPELGAPCFGGTSETAD